MAYKVTVCRRAGASCEVFAKNGQTFYFQWLPGRGTYESAREPRPRDAKALTPKQYELVCDAAHAAMSDERVKAALPEGETLESLHDKALAAWHGHFRLTNGRPPYLFPDFVRTWLEKQVAGYIPALFGAVMRLRGKERRQNAAKQEAAGLARKAHTLKRLSERLEKAMEKARARAREPELAV